MNYFLISANYLYFDFHKLFEEEDSGAKGKILWHINKNDPKSISVGDVCYLYYSNLPDNTSRIILRGIVSSTDKKDENEKNCLELENLQTINWNNSGRIKFTRKDLKAFGINITQNKQQIRNDKFIDRIEEYYKKDKQKLGLKELQTDIEKRLKCSFDSSNGKNSKHSTFIQKNGLRYFETHHLVQQKICKYFDNDEELYNAIYDKKNLIYLCPTCHRKIHYGKPEDIRRMIKTLYNRNKDFFDYNFSKYAKPKNVLFWLYSMYNV